MKKPPMIHFTKLLFLLFPFITAAQYHPVPQTMQFAGITVNFTEEARTIISNDVKSLIANRAFLRTKLDLTFLYFPIIETTLSAEGIPEDFKYLALQESGLLADAVSKSNAVGFWQFKKETAQDFGLRIDANIDERKNIHAATRAACLYLKKNNEILVNWISALNSYRTGLNNVYSHVPKEWYGSKDIIITDKADWYVLRAMAHKIVFEAEIKTYRPNDLVLYEYNFGAGKAFNTIAKELGVLEDDLWKYNRWVANVAVPDEKPYTILVPVSANEHEAIKAKALTLNGQTDGYQEDLGFPVLSRISAKVVGKKEPIFYEINNKAGIQAQVGDNVASICERADFDENDFIEFNDLAEGMDTKIIPNQVYYLEKKSKKAPIPFHTVTDGQEQNLWRVSQMYGLRLKYLLKYNRFDQPQRLQDGRVLWLSKTRAAKTPIEVVTLPTKPLPKDSDVPVMTYQVSKTLREPLQSGSVKVVNMELSDTNNEANTPTKETDSEEFKANNIPVKIHQVTNHTHIVTSGENYYSIARKYNISVSDLWTWNKLSKDIVLGIGKKLVIKFGHYFEPASSVLAQGSK